MEPGHLEATAIPSRRFLIPRGLKVKGLSYSAQLFLSSRRLRGRSYLHRWFLAFLLCFFSTTRSPRVLIEAFMEGRLLARREPSQPREANWRVLVVRAPTLGARVNAFSILSFFCFSPNFRGERLQEFSPENRVTTAEPWARWRCLSATLRLIACAILDPR